MKSLSTGIFKDSFSRIQNRPETIPQVEVRTLLIDAVVTPLAAANAWLPGIFFEVIENLGGRASAKINLFNRLLNGESWNDRQIRQA